MTLHFPRVFQDNGRLIDFTKNRNLLNSQKKRKKIFDNLVVIKIPFGAL